MTRKAFCSFICTGLLLVVASCGVSILPVGDPPRITAERLKALLGTPGVVVVDVRHEVLWNESPLKIAGAVRGDAKSITWAEKYPKDTFLVLYCS